MREIDPGGSAFPGRVENGVLEGRDGYLFLAGGRHDVMAFATGARPPPQASLEAFASNIDERGRASTARGAGFVHVIYPDKQSVMQNVFPDRVTRLGTIFLDFAGEVGRHVLYPAGLLADLSRPAFQRVDTHLTDEATANITVAICERLLGTPPEGVLNTLLASITREVETTGDLGSKLQPPRSEQVLLFSRAWPVKSLSNNLCGGNNGIIDLHLNEGALRAGRVLLFGDSFARRTAYALSHVFHEVLFLRTPFFHREMFEQMRPDYVISANAERYLAHVPPDDHAPSFLLYPSLGELSSRPDAGFAKALSAVLSYGRKPYRDFRGTVLG